MCAYLRLTGGTAVSILLRFRFLVGRAFFAVFAFLAAPAFRALAFALLSARTFAARASSSLKGDVDVGDARVAADEQHVLVVGGQRVLRKIRRARTNQRFVRQRVDQQHLGMDEEDVTLVGRPRQFLVDESLVETGSIGDGVLGSRQETTPNPLRGCLVR